jgi:hypothetical protein
MITDGGGDTVHLMYKNKNKNSSSSSSSSSDVTGYSSESAVVYKYSTYNR